MRRLQSVPAVQVFEDQISLIANPNDFKFGMGQRRLAFLFVIDAVCIGNPNSTTDASIAPETRQQLMNVLGPHLPAFVARLATPCNCERVLSRTLSHPSMCP